MDYKGKAIKSGVNERFWRSIVKKAVLKKYNHRCSDCGKEHDKLHLHHSDYDVQTIDTIKPLCPSCHKKAHTCENSEKTT